jgi:hypothetical protein
MRRPVSAVGPWLLLALSLCAALVATAGETRKLEEHNFAVEIPDWWMAAIPPPPGSVVAVESPRKDRTLLVVTSDLPPRELGVTRAEMVASARKQLEAQGFEIKNESQIESRGLSWTALEASTLHLKIVIWVAVVPGQGYLVRSDNKAGSNPAEDPEILASLRSFHLLWPVRADGSVVAAPTPRTGALDPDTSPGLTAGIVGGCLALVGVILFLAIFTGGRRKRR